MNNKKMVFFDIDGTLITEDTYIIPDSAKAAIKQAQANGHLMFINTGRPPLLLDPMLKELGFDGYVCGCGTYVEYHGEVLYSHEIYPEETKELVKAFREAHCEVIYEGRDVLHAETENQNEYIEFCLKRNADLGVPIVPTGEGNFTFDKFFLAYLDEPAFLALMDKLSGQWEWIDRGPSLAEVVPARHSKASGIQVLMDHLGIPLEQCYVLGDSNNDLPMLEFVPNSIAMGNASDSLKEKVAFVTADIEDDGVAKALKHFEII